jgi:hypothetical protein
VHEKRWKSFSASAAFGLDIRCGQEKVRSEDNPATFVVSRLSENHAPSIAAARQAHGSAPGIRGRTQHDLEPTFEFANGFGRLLVQTVGFLEINAHLFEAREIELWFLPDLNHDLLLEFGIAFEQIEKRSTIACQRIWLYRDRGWLRRRDHCRWRAARARRFRVKISQFLNSRRLRLVETPRTAGKNKTNDRRVYCREFGGVP